MATKTIEIPFGGLGNNPSDYDCKDGSLTLAVNVLHEDGSIKPFQASAPKTLRYMKSTQEIIYRHKNDNYCNYIYRDSDGSYGWFSEQADKFTQYDKDIFPNSTKPARRPATPVISVYGIGEDGEDELLNGTLSIDSNTNIKICWTWEISPIDNVLLEIYKGRTLVGALDTSKLPFRVNKQIINQGFYIYNISADESCEYTFELTAYSGNTERTTLYCLVVDTNQQEEISPSTPNTIITTKKTETSGSTFIEVPNNLVTNIISIGNTLILYTETETYYYLFGIEGTATVYSFLGNHLPEFNMEFNLNPHVYTGELGDSYDDIEETDAVVNSEGKVLIEKRNIVTDAVMGRVNRFTEGWCVENGYFSQPFLVRYAYRLYDGSLTMHSAPILMTPTSGSNPIIYIKGAFDSKKLKFGCGGIGSSLQYKIPSLPVNFTKWKDIITSVDIFVSAPFYTYNQGGVITELGYCNYLKFSGQTSDYIWNLTGYSKLANNFVNGNRTFKSMFDCLSNISNIQHVDYKGKLSIYSTGDIASQQIYYLVAQSGGANYSFVDYKNNSIAPYAFAVPLPERIGDLTEDIKSCGNFYQIKSIEVEGISAGGDIEIELKNQLGSIETRVAMTDEFESHHNISPSIALCYNNRLNISNASVRYFNGFSLNNLFQINDSSPVYTTFFYIYLKSGGKHFIRKSEVSNVNADSPFSFYYYPDPDAYQVKMVRKNISTGAYSYIDIPLVHHKSLNGSVYFNGIDSFILKKEFSSITQTEIDNLDKEVAVCPTISKPHTLYTSEANNPFVFNASNVEDIGNGTIVAMAPTTLPLGQDYGYAEMYCFTTDGIWALSVSNTGGWKAKQPFHYDVVLNEKDVNVLRMERDIAFATSRGLMLLSGNKVQCLTTIFDGAQDHFLDNVGWLQQFNSSAKNFIKNKLFTTAWGTSSSYVNIEAYQYFKEFIEDAIYLYDYPHQRIIIGNSRYTFCYVFSIKDSIWTSIPVKLIGAINSYPQCYAMIHDMIEDKNLLVDFAEEGSYENISLPYNGVIVTRPIKLNSPSIQKTIRTINLQGQFNKDHTGIVLLGCNDNNLQNWFMVSSCQGSRLPFRYGTPFKFFRLAVISKLSAGEALTGATIEYEFKELNKIRQ